MKNQIFILYLLLLTLFFVTAAETSDGTIPLDCPDVPNVKFQFHFTRELIALANAGAPFSGVEHLYIRIYDALDVFDRLVIYYDAKLAARKNWRNRQAGETIHLYTLDVPTDQEIGQGSNVTGIFAIVKGDTDVYLLNIVGSIPFAQVTQLLGNLEAIGVGIPELESLPELVVDKRALPSPTGFRAADGSPIYDILIEGNQKISTSEILDALEAENADIQKAVEILRKKMDSKLEAVELRVAEEDGRHSAVIRVKERERAGASGTMQAQAVVRFDRVSGWKLGSTFDMDLASARFLSGIPTSNLFGYAGYAFGNRMTHYELGIDSMPFATYTRLNNPEAAADSWYHGFGVNAKIHRITDTTPDAVLPYRRGRAFEAPSDLSYRFFGGDDLHNYYLRTGAEVAFRWETLPRLEHIDPTHLVTLTLLAEDHQSLEKSTDWHIFNWRSVSKARANPAITPAQLRSIRLKYDFRTRKYHLGWHNTFLLEYSSDGFGSTSDFTRYQLHLRYARAFGGHQVRTRAIGSFANTTLPIQRQFAIGGPGVLNGYPLYAFTGDRGYLFNITFFYNLPNLFNWGNLQLGSDFNLFLVFFFDAGQTWDVVTDETHTLLPQSDAGIGLQIGEPDSFLRFNVAKAFESGQAAQFNIVWYHSF